MQEWPIDQNVAMGQLAFAISLEHLLARKAAGELTEAQVSQILERALARFEPQARAQLRAMITR